MRGEKGRVRRGGRDKGREKGGGVRGIRSTMRGKGKGNDNKSRRTVYIKGEEEGGVGRLSEEGRGREREGEREDYEWTIFMSCHVLTSYLF